jgi:calcineurin-like phosphoesterase family protein
LRTWDFAHHGSWHLHGHCHGSLKHEAMTLDVGIDNSEGFKPWSFDQVKTFMKPQTYEPVDHHAHSKGNLND